MKEKIRIIILSGLFFFLFLSSFGQEENIWIFGSGAGLDFNFSPPKGITSSIQSNEGCASVCDEKGNLLFYTDGSNVWDRNHLIMSNGFSIQPYSNAWGAGISSTSQGALIVPVPGSESRYYIFSLTCYEQGPADMGKLFHSVVDMDLNNGLGDVEKDTKGILTDSLLTEQMTSVRGNDCNVWLLTVRRDGYLKAFEISRNGIKSPVISSVTESNPSDMNPLVNSYGITGCMDVSPDRRKIAIARNVLAVYDFDVKTGLATKPLILSEINDKYYSVCFSPDNSKLYSGIASGSGAGINQFDLSDTTLPEIINSKVTVHAGANRYYIKRAPDLKIYIARFNSQTLDVIRFPDLTGAACMYMPDVQPLSEWATSKLGLPNTISRYTYTDTLVLINAVEACFTDQLKLFPSSAASKYTWSTGDTARNITVTQPGTYWVTYGTSDCKFNIDTFRVTFFNPLLVIDASCKDDSNGKAKLIVGDSFSAYTLTWLNSNDDTLSVTDSLYNVAAGNYYLRVNTTNGCDTVLPILIPEVDYKVSFDADRLICENDTVTFINTSDDHFTDFNWYFGDGSESNIRDPYHIYNQDGVYSAMLVGRGYSCVDTAYKTITVDVPVWDISFSLDRDEICTGEEVNFSPHIDSSVVHLSWSFGDQTGFTAGRELVRHAYDISGMMHITLNASFRACPDIEYTGKLIVHGFPQIDLGPDSMICYPGRPILLYNHYPDIEGYRYLWNTGDTNRTMIAERPGSYSLTITNEQGCAATEHITVTKDCHIDIPNVFTPNGDGVNDYFFPRQLLSESIASFRMQIFNRWGQPVFETNNAEGRGWDGKLNGKDQPEGAYIYTIMVTFSNGYSEKYQGSIMLIR